MKQLNTDIQARFDMHTAKDEEEHARIIREWARSVWNA
jgi:hypothetical protein